MPLSQRLEAWHRLPRPSIIPASGNEERDTRRIDISLLIPIHETQQPFARFASRGNGVFFWLVDVDRAAMSVKQITGRVHVNRFARWFAGRKRAERKRYVDPERVVLQPDRKSLRFRVAEEDSHPGPARADHTVFKH